MKKRQQLEKAKSKLRSIDDKVDVVLTRAYPLLSQVINQVQTFFDDRMTYRWFCVYAGGLFASHITVVILRNGITSHAILKRVDEELWRRMCKRDTWAPCWVQRFNVKVAHFGAPVLKKRLPGKGSTLKKRKKEAEGLLLSTVAPKWAALTFNLCTQHGAQVSRLHILRHNSSSTCFRTACEVTPCSTQFLTTRTVQYESTKIRCLSQSSFYVTPHRPSPPSPHVISLASSAQ